MRLVIVGTHLPGRHCHQPHGIVLRNVHVGLQVGRDPADLVAADAPSARWETDVRVLAADDGSHDFRGPAVQGKKGERFVYLTWGDVDSGAFNMFRRAKLMLGVVDPGLIKRAEISGRSLVGTVPLTDGRGGPLCARVVPPTIAWSID
jgi:Family of unknown function (DUF5990)